MTKLLYPQSPIKTILKPLTDLPTPSNISLWWNFGSILGLCLIVQILSGLFLAIHYTPDTQLAFNRIIHICRDVNYGWLLRTIHANGASFFFLCLYLHIGRGIYYNSYIYLSTWLAGIIILFIIIATAFIGYVLPWGQISFWGATVITNLFSTIPFIGKILVQWIWGGFSVNNATLTRFFTFHFILPFIAIFIASIHIVFLHSTGSNNPLGINSNNDKIPFHPYFIIKDLISIIIIITLLIYLVLINPYALGDPDNFIPANPLVTPLHIQPEWYFLFAYAILRSIPNKLGGVIALLISILILIIIPFYQLNNLRGVQFYPLNQIIFWIFTTLFILLTWIGACPVETPYVVARQLIRVIYFIYFIINPLIHKWWNNLLN